MKAKILLTILALSSALCALSQVPQGINYQAIARDLNGDPITGVTMQVRLGILSDTITPVTVWEELHSTVKTNAFGLFTAVLGTGARQSGSALTFADIDWTKTPLYLRTWIYYPSAWKYLGTSKIWSVPYSLVAGGLDGALDKLEVKGDDISSDEALFEVKRKDGETMFAVYNHGVRVYMPLDTMSKARKGGFAIGGFDRAKGTVQDYFIVNPDSIRAYIDSDAGKARKGGFAIGSFDRAKADIQKYFTVSSDSVRIYIDDNLSKANKGGFAIGSFDRAKGGNANFFNVAPDSTGRIYPSQNRIQWYPLKNAFLTGKIIAENKDSIGENSFASGYESRAKGQYSQALGYKAMARGDYSTAIGKKAVANKVNSFAFGENASAKNEESYAFGRGAIAEGFRSYAFGSAGVDSAGQVTGVAYAKGNYSFAIGQGSQALGNGSFTLGLADTAKGEYSTAIGYLNRASGKYSTAMGIGTTASGWNSTATGQGTIASGVNSITMGVLTTASGWNSTALGYRTTASGDFSTAIGKQTIASGDCSTTMGGFFTTASGDYSTAMGYQTTASGHFSTSMGVLTTASGWNSTGMGFQATASGGNSTAMGYYTKANTFSMVTFGRYNDTTKYHGGNSYTTWYDDDPLFVIGNGTSDNARHNAVTVLKKGNFGIGSLTPTAKLEVNLANSSGWSGNLKALRVYAPDNGYYLDLNTSIISAGNTGYHLNPNGNTGLTISTPGYVGIGTSNPGYHLDIYTGVLGTSLDSKLLMQKIDGLSGVTGNDDQLRIIMRRFVAGSGWGSSETRIQKTIDVTDMGYISFKADYLEFGGGYGGSTYMTLKNGNLGIGNTDPGYKLVVNGTAWCTSGAWTGSDIRWKKDIADLNNVLSDVLKLQPVSYQLRTEDFPEMNFEKGDQVGLIAQDVEELFPALVKTDRDGYKAVAYDKLSAVLIGAIKEQQQQIESYESLLKSLQEEVEQIKEMLAGSRIK